MGVNPQSCFQALYGSRPVFQCHTYPVPALKVLQNASVQVQVYVEHLLQILGNVPSDRAPWLVYSILLQIQLGAFNAANESFAKEKNSKCAYINKGKLAQMLINLMDNDKEKVLRDVSFIGNLAMIISLNYKKKCLDANDHIVPENGENLMNIKIVNYYSLNTVKW